MSASSEPGGRPPAEPRRRITARQLAGGLLFVLMVVFVFENTRSVKVRIIGPEVKAPLFVALVIAALLGALVMLLLQWRRRRPD
jgi:uncharacterized integral membrane protein